MRKKAAIGIGLAAALVVALVFAVPRGGIPQVVIEDETAPVDENGSPLPVAGTVVKGSMSHTMTVNYKDGQKKSYSSTASFPDLALGSVLDTANKEIVSIDFSGRAKIQVPQGADRVRQNADVLSTVTVYLGNVEIDRKTSTKQYDISTLGDVELYKFNVPLENITVAPGKYVLNFKTIDEVKFYLADFSAKVMRLEANPALGLEKDAALKEIFVVHTKPTVTAGLEYLPVYGAFYYNKDQVVGQQKTLVVKASNFKPSSPISFQYDDDSTIAQRNLNQGLNQWVTAGLRLSSDHVTDATGSAKSSLVLPSIYHDYNCYHYYSKYVVSDGQNVVSGTIGCTVDDWKAATGSYPTR